MEVKQYFIRAEYSTLLVLLQKLITAIATDRERSPTQRTEDRPPGAAGIGHFRFQVSRFRNPDSPMGGCRTVFVLAFLAGKYGWVACALRAFEDRQLFYG